MRLGRTSLALGLLLPVAVFASCADSSPNAPYVEPDGAAVIPPPPDAGDAGSEAGKTCDAGDPGCSTETLPCTETDFCSVASAINAHFSVNALWVGSPTDVWLVGSAGTIARLDGTTFKLEPAITAYSLNAIWGTASDNLWTVSTPDVILRRGASGVWEKAEPIATGGVVHNILLRSVWGPQDGSGVLAAGDALPPQMNWEVPPHKQVWTAPFEDGGTWSPLSDLDYYVVRGMWGSAADDVWTVGLVRGQVGGMAYHSIKSEKGGIAGWAPTDIQASNQLDAVWGSSANDVWTVGTQGTIRHYAGTGTRWDVVESPTTQDLHAVWGSGTNDVWAAGDAGTIIHWDGAKWRHLVVSYPVGPKPNLFGIAGSGPNDVWAVGSSGTVLHSAGIKTKEAP